MTMMAGMAAAGGPVAEPGDILTRIGIPTVDVSDQTERHVIVAPGTAKAWNGHPSTVMLPDGRTIFCVWQGRRDGTRQHGAPGGFLKRSDDGGLSWGESKPIVDKAGASEPACVRSPDGRQLLLLIRENNREMNSLFAVSDDEGGTWSAPRELPLALTGDRFLARYAPDGRLVIVFRPVPPGRKESLRTFEGSHFTAWVGRYEDIVGRREGRYLVKLAHSHRGGDHTYPGLEVLPDGTFVATTYIQYRPDPELQSILSVRFKL